jgi:hypothetical protein
MLFAAAIVTVTSALTAYQVACLYGVRTWGMEAMLRVVSWLARIEMGTQDAR